MENVHYLEFYFIHELTTSFAFPLLSLAFFTIVLKVAMLLQPKYFTKMHVDINKYICAMPENYYPALDYLLINTGMSIVNGRAFSLSFFCDITSKT